MIPKYGRAKGKERCFDKAPNGHYETMTFIAGLSLNRIVAPWCLDKPMTGDTFKIYVKTQLLPELKAGDIVVMDNLSCHKVNGIIEMIESIGAKVLYLPPYSPDLNPIEQLFSKLKHLLRKAMARSYEELWKTIGKFLDYFSPQDYLGYFHKAGYVST